MKGKIGYVKPTYYVLFFVEIKKFLFSLENVNKISLATEILRVAESDLKGPFCLFKPAYFEKGYFNFNKQAAKYGELRDIFNEASLNSFTCFGGISLCWAYLRTKMSRPFS